MTRADTIVAARDEDTALIADLRRRLAERERQIDALKLATAAIDDATRALGRIALALGLPESATVNQIIVRIQETA